MIGTTMQIDNITKDEFRLALIIETDEDKRIAAALSKILPERVRRHGRDTAKPGLYKEIQTNKQVPDRLVLILIE